MRASTLPHDYYASPGPLTDPGAYAPLLAGLPTDIPTLVKVVQGQLVHIFWAGRYGLDLSEAQKSAVQARPVSEKLEQTAALDPRPLAVPRPLEARQVGNCRDFTLLLVTLLRCQGTPARARCGFGAYFLPGHYEDHWVGEYWDAGQGRWVLVDAQLDDLQRQVLEIPFDPLDVPRDQFIVGGQAWQMARRGGSDPASFGIFDMHGLWFIWGNVMRDLLALNKVEILPWDYWSSPYWAHRLEDPVETTEDLSEYDRVAALTLAGDEGFEALRAEYAGNPGLQPPAGWTGEPA